MAFYKRSEERNRPTFKWLLRPRERRNRRRFFFLPLAKKKKQYCPQKLLSTKEVGDGGGGTSVGVEVEPPLLLPSAVVGRTPPCLVIYFLLNKKFSTQKLPTPPVFSPIFFCCCWGSHIMLQRTHQKCCFSKQKRTNNRESRRANTRHSAALFHLCRTRTAIKEYPVLYFTPNQKVRIRRHNHGNVFFSICRTCYFSRFSLPLALPQSLSMDLVHLKGLFPPPPGKGSFLWLSISHCMFLILKRKMRRP